MGAPGRDRSPIRPTLPLEKGGGYWGDCIPRQKHRPWVYLTVPPLARWTRDTLSQVITIARAELTRRGATGAQRISVAVPDYSPHWHLSSVDLAVHVGNLRASVTLDAGTVHYALPHEIVYTLTELVAVPSETLKRIVKHAREQEAAARAAGGVL